MHVELRVRYSECNETPQLSIDLAIHDYDGNREQLETILTEARDRFSKGVRTWLTQAAVDVRHGKARLQPRE